LGVIYLLDVIFLCGRPTLTVSIVKEIAVVVFVYLVHIGQLGLHVPFHTVEFLGLLGLVLLVDDCVEVLALAHVGSA